MAKKIADDLLDGGDGDLIEMREILAKEANQMANRANEMSLVGAAIILHTLAGALYRNKEEELAALIQVWLKKEMKRESE